KLLTPIVPHTAEEMWEYIPETGSEYVQLTDIPEPIDVFSNDEIENKWNHFMKVRDDVLKALEEARDEKIIGKSLEAKVTITPKDETTRQVLQSIPYLHQMLIVSGVKLSDNESSAKAYKYVNISVEEYPGETCERCWTAS